MIQTSFYYLKGMEYPRLSPLISFLAILFHLGLSDLGIYSYCISSTIYRCGRCDYKVLCELFPIVLFKKSIVILEREK